MDPEIITKVSRMPLKRHRSRSHRSRAHRLRLKERVRRRYRLRQWRRVLVGLSVLVGAGLILGGTIWAAVYLISLFQPGESRPIDFAPAEVLTEPRLIGVWQSDADANLGELRRTQNVTEQQERELRKHAFQTRITYTDKMMATDKDGEVELQAYQVVAKEGDEVVIKTWFNETRQDEEVHIRFVGPDTCWVQIEQFHLAECFRRVK